MERLASGCSAIQGTACNKRVRFLVPSSVVSLRLPAPCILATLSLSSLLPLFLSPVSHSFVSFLCARSLSLFRFLSLTHSRSFKYTQRGTSCGLFVLYTRTLRFLSVALLQTYACTRAHTNATRSTVKRRRDEKSPATGFHEPANRPQNLAGAQKNRLLFILSLVLSFSFSRDSTPSLSFLVPHRLRPSFRALSGSSLQTSTPPPRPPFSSSFFTRSSVPFFYRVSSATVFLRRDSTFAFCTAELLLKGCFFPRHRPAPSEQHQQRNRRRLIADKTARKWR